MFQLEKMALSDFNLIEQTKNLSELHSPGIHNISNASENQIQIMSPTEFGISDFQTSKNKIEQLY